MSGAYRRIVWMFAPDRVWYGSSGIQEFCVHLNILCVVIVCLSSSIFNKSNSKVLIQRAFHSCVESMTLCMVFSTFKFGFSETIYHFVETAIGFSYGCNNKSGIRQPGDQPFSFDKHGFVAMFDKYFHFHFHFVKLPMSYLVIFGHIWSHCHIWS